MALFLQFIVSHAPYTQQFLLLALTFCALIVVIHLIYALCAHALRHSGETVLTAINTAGGTAYIGFAVALLFSRRTV